MNVLSAHRRIVCALGIIEKQVHVVLFLENTLNKWLLSTHYFLKQRKGRKRDLNIPVDGKSICKNLRLQYNMAVLTTVEIKLQTWLVSS
jgi:hypothetical protein